jgi:hypothetical protein
MSHPREKWDTRRQSTTDQSPYDMSLAFLSDLALVVTVAVFVLAVLEVFLSARQKQWLEDRALHVWHWLAEAKRTSLLNWLQRHYQSIAWTGAVLVSAYMTWAFEKHLAPLSQVVPIAFCIFAVGLFFGLKMIQLTLRAPSLFRAVIRATIIVVATLAPAVIFFTLVSTFKGDLIDLAKDFAAGVAAHTVTLGLALFALFYLWTLILCVHLTVIAVIFWAVVALPLAVTCLLTILLFCSEFVVRRIAEYPKGPIFAGSLLLVAIAGVLRVMSAQH